MTAQEEERLRVSRELHDQICEQLAWLAVDMGGLAADPQISPAVHKRIRLLQGQLVKTYDGTRHVAYELHSSLLDDLGLTASLSERLGGETCEHQLMVRPRQLVLHISDDGVGFHAGKAKGRGGLGLIGMEERARVVNGGRLSIMSEPGNGTRVALHNPCAFATL